MNSNLKLIKTFIDNPNLNNCVVLFKNFICKGLVCDSCLFFKEKTEYNSSNCKIMKAMNAAVLDKQLFATTNTRKQINVAGERDKIKPLMTKKQIKANINLAVLYVELTELCLLLEEESKI